MIRVPLFFTKHATPNLSGGRMSLYDLDYSDIREMPNVDLRNTITNHVMSGLETVGWEPAGRTSPQPGPNGETPGIAQLMQQGERVIRVTVEVVE